MSYLDNFVSREVEARNIGSITRHKIAVKHSEDRFMRDNEKVILFALEL